MTSLLVVDDSAFDRARVAACIEEHGYTARMVGNGREALSQIEQETPDLVLTDMMMPVMDGLQLVQEIRKRFPRVPVILMTGKGKGAETAMEALRAGAASYIPKNSLAQSLGDTIRAIQKTQVDAEEMKEAWAFLEFSESRYTIGYEPHARNALIAHFEEDLRRFQICDEADLIRVGTALTEALANAIDHGNLELDSSIREEGEEDYYALGRERSTQDPYKNRRVYIRSCFTKSEVTFVIRDEGDGFDHTSLPDPRDPDNLTRLSGRGILLIRTFMDDVRFNDAGNEITMLKRRNSQEEDQ